MSVDIEIKPVFVNAPQPAALPKITPWLRFKSWAWNVARRPLVRIRQRELIRISDSIKADLGVDLLPKLYKNRLDCQECIDAYLALSSEVFTSSLRLILTKMQCTEHYLLFNEFLNAHQKQFERNEKVARWINGL